jgi:NIPSNAP
MNDTRCPVVELRQYTLHRGQRDVLIDLFDREFVETQEDVGIAVLGQFRDLDEPDRFVWLRGFPGMPARAESLHRFYSGPAWKANSAAANATMIDSDNVLLLRPVTARSGFPAGPGRPPIGPATPPRSAVLATIYYRDRPFDEAFADLFDQRVRPLLSAAGAAPLACFQTEYAENTFPALPVRTGENAFVWFARFPTVAHLDAHLDQPDPALPVLTDVLSGPPERLRLAPTARSQLR